MRHDLAEEALRALLDELPAEFSTVPPDAPGPHTRESFKVVKRRNVRAVHEALWDLQVYFGLQEDE